MNEKTLAENKDFIRGRKPNTLCLDLEISPMLAYTYEAYDGNVLKIKVLPQIVAFAYSLNGGKIIAKALPDYKGYKPGILNIDDKELVKELHEVMEGVDFIYGHNVRDFDIKHAKARFIIHDLAVTKKWVVEDTLKIARKYFKFPKNNLDFLTEELDIGTKTDVKHSDVIWACIDGDMKKWEAMKKYVIQDIKISVGLFKKLSPWHETHTNLNLFTRKYQSCPVCLSQKTQRRGRDISSRGFFRWKYQCQSCGHWWRGERIEKEVERVEQFNI